MKPRHARLLLSPLLAAALLPAATLAQDAPKPTDAPPPPPYTLAGHIDVVSRYYLRGITDTYGNARPFLNNAAADAPESEKPALQWGVDWTHASGIYAGYWGSTINYSYKRLGQLYYDPTVTDFQDDKSIENDFYGGYSGTIGPVGYTAGLIYYWYYNGRESDTFETKLGLSYGPFSLSAQTLLKDVVWGNRGDTYFTLNYATTLPYDVNLSASLGWYRYEQEGKFLGSVDTRSGAACGPGAAFNVGGCVAGNEPVGNAFRHLIVGVTKVLPGTPIQAGLQAIVAGENRFGVRQSDKVVASLSYVF